MTFYTNSGDCLVLKVKCFVKSNYIIWFIVRFFFLLSYLCLILYKVCFLDLILNYNQLKIYTLTEIEMQLKSYVKGLFHYPLMPHADITLVHDVKNRMIHYELNHDKKTLADERFRLMSTMTTK